MPGTMIQSLYEAGVVEPLFFAAAMALLIPPIAGIVAARPLRPGVAAPAAAARIAAGIAAADTVAAILAILLAVLVFRMPLDRWARGLVGAISITAAVLATGTAAGSAG